MNAHTPTWEVQQVYETKSAILRAWEAEPAEIQLENAEYISELVQRVRKLRVYLQHRKDSPI